VEEEKEVCWAERDNNKKQGMKRAFFYTTTNETEARAR
jgi:hypothetical protein